jgi:uncharacterized 2Fe-2S/4Fe-4S cluster protein (DUF4445 family)
VEKIVLTLEPSGQRIEAEEGSTYLQVIRMTGNYVRTDCGGRGTCGKCTIHLIPSPQPTEADRKQLSDTEIREGSRLACQHAVSQGTRVILPDLAQDAKVLTESVTTTELKPDREEGYGVAIDLGTTTVVCYLMDLSSGTLLDVESSLNPQIAFGEDVITRITLAIRDRDTQAALQDKLWRSVSESISLLLDRQLIPQGQLARITVVGNTAMHHLALGLDVESLSLAPYTPSMVASHVTRGGNLGLDGYGQTQMFFAPNIAGWVGGDTVAFILSQKLHERSEDTLGIDIGTNGEIVAISKGKLACCSAAAGPAFEGARVTQGMRAQNGAVEYLTIEEPEEPPEVSVIGGSPPRGLCGSGILDAVSELRRTNLLDQSGRLRAGERVVNLKPHGLAYAIRFADEFGAEKDIFLTQKDIRQLQLAKAAIRSGIEILIDHMGTSADSIHSFYVAGAFGNYMHPESALRIGLLPPVSRKKIIPVGNAAGAGARIALLSEEARNAMDHIARSARYVELAREPSFEETFCRAMRLTPQLAEKT